MLVEFQVASMLVVPLEVADNLLQIILMVCFLGAVVMWPKHACFPIVGGIEAPCLPVTEPFCQCSEEEGFEIPVFLTAVFKSSMHTHAVYELFEQQSM